MDIDDDDGSDSRNDGMSGATDDDVEEGTAFIVSMMDSPSTVNENRKALREAFHGEPHKNTRDISRNPLNITAFEPKRPKH